MVLLSMDDLVLFGAAGILGLFLAAVILLFGIYYNRRTDVCRFPFRIL